MRYGFSIKTCAINLIYEAARKLIPGSFAVIAKKLVMRFAQPQSPQERWIYTGKVARWCRTRFNIVFKLGHKLRRMIIFPIKGLKLFTAVRITKGLPPRFVLHPFFNKK
jgi:hypothetical protein